jgi:hypothetical protein
MQLKKLSVFMSAVVCLLTINTAIAQKSLHHVEKCGQAITTSEELKDEKFARSFFALQDAVEKKLARQQNTPKTIPTIIHVIQSTYDFTELDIQNEFDYLNEQFEINNTDISFCLEDVRFYEESELSSWCSNPIYCYNQVQNEIGENTGDIMEVYIGEWSGGILGFTALPPANVGVWVRATEVVDSDSKTFTHEAGHWCGLSHTFSRDLFGNNYSCTTALNEVDCELEGDRVCDTPPTAIDWSCQDACPDIDEVDESYMSYAPDNCQDLFTPGQINRMHAQLELGRTAAINNECSGCDLGNCPWDLDGNGYININDFLDYLTWHTQTGACLPADFNYDGVVDVNDLTLFLVNYGTECDTGDAGMIESGNLKNLVRNLDDDIVEVKWVDILGRTYSEYGDLTPGFYIQVEEYIGGIVITRKIFIR